MFEDMILEIENTYNDIGLRVLSFKKENNNKKSNRFELIDRSGYKYSYDYSSIKNKLISKEKLSIFVRNPNINYNTENYFKVEKIDLKFIERIPNTSNNTRIQCPNGHVSDIPFSRIVKKKSSSCPKCNKRLITMDIIEEEFKDRGYSVLRNLTKFNGAKTRVFYNCPKHGEKNISYDSFNSGVGCMDCGRIKTTQALKFSYNDFMKDFKIIDNQNFYLLSTEDDFINTRCQMVLKHKKCGHEFPLGVHNILKNRIYCPYCEVFGENSRNWRGGITPLHKYLRGSIGEWKRESGEKDSYKCIISNSNNIAIHHIYSFNLILNEVIELTKLPIYQEVSSYSDSELELLRNMCVELHNKNPLGVCLREDLHKEFHSMYGYGNNSIEQFQEFYSNKVGSEYELKYSNHTNPNVQNS